MTPHRTLLLVVFASISGGACTEQAAKCPDGTVGCPCRANRECDVPGDGSPRTCIAGTCRACEQGRESCGCFADGTCLPGLSCADGVRCSYSADALRPPAAPRCYSPCTEGLTLQNGD